jgi:glycosyltransferase involved in cell wall biosynthesis
MIKISFLIRSLESGGAERHLTTLVKELDKNRFDVTVVTFYPGGHFEKELEDADVRLNCLHKRGRWEVLRFFWRLVGELRRLDPDILHSYLVEPNLISVLLRPMLPLTKVVWSIQASNMQLKRYDWFVRTTFNFQRFLSRFPDLIISNSDAGRAYHLARGFPSRKFIVIHNGIDTLTFKPDQESGKRIRETWQSAKQTVLIGLVARLDPMKDHKTFLKAAAILSAADSDIRFVCVGSGPQDYAGELRRLAEEYGISNRLIWAGERDDMPAVYNALDIACSSSVSEGLPNAIAEAMACDVPCVVTDVGDSALLVGDTGIVVPPNDAQALADGLKECMNLLASQQRPSPRSRIEERFGISHLKTQTQAALTKLAANTGRV